MASRDFAALSLRRAARARRLAGRFPESAEALHFFAAIAEFQTSVPPDDPLSRRESLVDLIQAHGTPLLRGVAGSLDHNRLERAMEAYLSFDDTSSPASLFARVLLQPQADAIPEPQHVADGRCPYCGHRPQVGCLSAEGDGTALVLVCSLCLRRWPFGRDRCSACLAEGEASQAYYSADSLPHIRAHTCEECQSYLHLVNLEADPEAIPEVDELAALALDVAMRERGYTKKQPNLIGI